MRNFANLCIMVWIHMDAHVYVFVFQNLNILCIFSDRFFDPVFFGSGSVLVFGVDRFNDRFGSSNIGLESLRLYQLVISCEYVHILHCLCINKVSWLSNYCVFP
jgi:hypothetical protein